MPADYARTGSKDESDDDLSSMGDSSDENGYYKSGRQDPDNSCLPVCCTAACCCHWCYVILFLTYLVVFPLWCKWLLTAPMPFEYWSQDYPNFPRMPLHQSTVSWRNETFDKLTGLPQITISPIPTGTSSCNGTCAAELYGYRTSEINFDITVGLNKPDLTGKAMVHVAYPVLFASEDFKHWQLVADRRHAMPTPYFNDLGGAGIRKYVSVQESCSRPPSSTGMDSLSSSHQYIVACVTWSSADSLYLRGLKGDDELTSADMALKCNYVGGVCGWPCNSQIPPDRLESCSKTGQIDQAALDKLIPTNQTDKTETIGNISKPVVRIKACEDALSGECATEIEDLGSWNCHQCKQEPATSRRLQVGIGALPPLTGGAAPPLLPGDPAGVGTGTGTGTDTGTDTTTDDDGNPREWRSLPRLLVELVNAQLPQAEDIMSTPRAYIFSAESLDGPWKKVYPPQGSSDTYDPPVPVNAPKGYENTVANIMGDEVRAMTLVTKNRLSMTPSSCFGKRGPMYIVACAVNQSIYDQKNQWENASDPRFMPGQAVAGPPFNDRCVAVSGRCGHACLAHDESTAPIPHCLPSGYINQSALTSLVEAEYNRKPAVFLFVFVLLFGFAVKTIMLCPGIFAPYPRCHYYDPELTEQLRYILVVGVTGGGDEGKGTMIRNTIGMISGLPPMCKCRFIVCNNEEGHRLEMMTCWERLCTVVSSIPNAGGLTYEENIRKFFRQWVEDTRNMRLKEVGAKVKELDPKIADRLSGRVTLAKVKKSLHWAELYSGGPLERFEAQIEALHADLTTAYNKFTPMTPHEDYVRDWIPPDRNSTSLRMHFTSRAKPPEDPRNIMVQHVAVGTWYYKVSPSATPDQWLDLRKKCHEMVYASLDDDGVSFKVPLRSSHGKAGGLNFVDNYISIVNQRPENEYGTDQDTAPSLYAIADARHQFQPDFMLSCVPAFFDEDNMLNQRVGFTQAPQHYPEYTDKYDYLDNNNAQFFRLNAMIRNCCGGVSSCGTNGMWQLPHRPPDSLWLFRKKRVRDRDHRLRKQFLEREQFHTSCKIEDTASSLDRVLQGEYSQFVNRKLSFGMCKDPEGYLGAQQRWVEGAITLFWQWTTGNADAHGDSKKNGPLLWLVIIAFTGFVFSLCRMVSIQYTSSIFVELGLIDAEKFDKILRKPLSPFITQFYDILLAIRGGRSADNYNYQVYEDMTLQFIVFVLTCVAAYFMLWIFTNFSRFCTQFLRRSCSCIGLISRFCIDMPYEMKWWGRLVISFDNLTYWMWFWTSFFWIGFNFYLATTAASFHFNNIGMMSFMLVTTFLNYALIISNSMRFTIMESVDANEVAFLSMDNIWRANQLFFMVGPIQGFSVITGTKNFLNYLLYGQDIGGWSGGDLTQVSIMIVKYWTTAIILCSISCWIYLFVSDPTPTEYQSRRPGCIIFSFIAMDVLHPCIYLWTIGNNLSEEEVAKMTWCQALLDSRWWKRMLSNIILTETLTNIFRYIAPVYNIMLPVLVFYTSAFGVAGGFTLVAVGAGH